MFWFGVHASSSQVKCSQGLLFVCWFTIRHFTFSFLCVCVGGWFACLWKEKNSLSEMTFELSPEFFLICVDFARVCRRLPTTKNTADKAMKMAFIFLIIIRFFKSVFIMNQNVYLIFSPYTFIKLFIVRTVEKLSACQFSFHLPFD